MIIFQFFFFLLYRFVWTPLILTLAIFIYPFNRKIREGFTERRNALNKTNIIRILAGRQPILIHASSGEFEYAKPIIREIKNRHPNIPIVVTFFSPSYAKAIRKDPGVDIALPLPLDLPTPIRSFLRTLNPSLILIARTDIWPEFVNQAQKLKIPTLLFSCTVRPQTGWRQLLGLYYFWLYSKLTQIYCVDTTDLTALQKISPNIPAKAFGDSRYDQVIFRLQHPKNHKTELFQNIAEPILVAGSTWPEDEKVILPAVAELLKNRKMRLIIAPHEPSPERLKKIDEQLQQLQILTAYYSHIRAWETPVLIIDQVGYLAETYSYAQVAFVGGSYRKKVHSVMEPLAAGLPVLVGPQHTNNREAQQFQHISTNSLQAIVRSADDQNQFRQILAETLKSLESNLRTKEQIKNEVIKKSGASKNVITWIESKLNKDKR